MDQKKIGSFMAELRKEKGLTQEQFGEKLNVSQRTISRWETGKNMPDISLLSAICEVLGISLTELIKGERISEETITKEEVSGILSSVISLAKEKRHRKNLLAAVVSGIITLVCMFALYNDAFSINVTSTTDLERAINEYHFSEEIDVNVLERQAVGNQLIVLYAQNEHPTCGGIAQLEKGIFGKYQMVSANDFTWPLYNIDVATVTRTRYAFVCGINELPDAASYEFDVVKANGEVQTYTESVREFPFLHVTEIGEGAVPPIRYFDSNGQEISRDLLLAEIKEDEDGASSGIGTAERWLLYVYEFIILGVGVVIIRYYLPECKLKGSK